jgi:hypothetical protein
MEAGDMGKQRTAKLAAKDVCLTIWDDLYPNHFKGQGEELNDGRRVPSDELYDRADNQPEGMLVTIR